MKAIRYWLYKYPSLLHERFSIDFVLEALEFVLDNSNFQFNNNFYSLISGTVTGTKVAPTYANLTVAFLEISLYDKVKEIYGENIQKYVISNWKRFLDDGQILWKKSFGNIEDFVNILNSLDNNIHFTHECSTTGLPYLNLFLYIENEKLLTDIYYKDTDSHDYLPFSSCHPRHTKINIPQTLARIICTVVDDPKRKQFRLMELKAWLKKAGYPISLIESAFLKVNKVDQLTLRAKVPPKSENLLVYVETHNPKNPKVFEHLSKFFNFLKSFERFSKLFEGTKLIRSERQPKNLGHLLQHSCVNLDKPKNGCQKCNKKSCGTCQYILETDSIYFSRLDIYFKLLNAFTCESGNIIYKITCNGCGEFYIGLTVNLRHRVTNHKFCLFNEASRIQKVHRHIHDCAGSMLVPFSIVPFYKVKRDTNVARLSTESFFIRKFNPRLNRDK
ncbi:MAG: GIY-YIG nuclease family protein [Campylobacteraceae bacterium]|nr:GIY-YIG nuclease family protein [Campylobacteraceae bacterium]